MKEIELIQLKNQVKEMRAIQRAILSQMADLKDLLIGMLETLKLMEGYEEALTQLKENLRTDSGKKNEDENE